MRTTLIILAMSLGLQACGLKGPLVLPAPTAQPAPSSQAATTPVQDTKK